MKSLTVPFENYPPSPWLKNGITIKHILYHIDLNIRNNIEFNVGLLIYFYYLYISGTSAIAYSGTSCSATDYTKIGTSAINTLNIISNQLSITIVYVPKTNAP